MTSRSTSAYVPAAAAFEDDVCTRHLIGRHPRTVVEVPTATTVTLLDIDTSETLDSYRARPAR